MSADLARGARYLARGASMLGHPSLRLFVFVPLLVNIVIFASLLGIGFGYVTGMMDWMDARLPDWLDFLQWILWPLIVVTACLISGYLFTSVALVIASPFNGLLADRRRIDNALGALGAEVFIATPRTPSRRSGVESR